GLSGDRRTQEGRHVHPSRRAELRARLRRLRPRLYHAGRPCDRRGNPGGTVKGRARGTGAFRARCRGHRGGYNNGGGRTMTILQMLIDAASVGGLYALTALGLGLIFGVIGLVNFAYGEYIMVGAYVLLLTAGFYWPFAILAVLIFVVLFALTSDWLVFRRVRRAPPETLMIVSFGLSFMIQHAYVVFFGSLTRTVNFLPEINRSIEIAGVRVAGVSLLQIAATIVLTTALALFINYTRVGYQMRAVSENPRMARLVGVNSNRVIAAAFAISAVLAVTVTTLFVAQTGSMTP